MINLTCITCDKPFTFSGDLPTVDRTESFEFTCTCGSTAVLAISHPIHSKDFNPQTAPEPT
jgi:hypothetical protein